MKLVQVPTGFLSAMPMYRSSCPGCPLSAERNRNKTISSGGIFRFPAWIKIKEPGDAGYKRIQLFYAHWHIKHLSEIWFIEKYNTPKPEFTVAFCATMDMNPNVFQARNHIWSRVLVCEFDFGANFIRECKSRLAPCRIGCFKGWTKLLQAGFSVKVNKFSASEQLRFRYSGQLLDAVAFRWGYL